MHRRSFLGALFAAPVALPVAAKAMAAEPTQIAIGGVDLKNVLGQTKPVLALSEWKEFKGPSDFRVVELRMDHSAVVIEEAYMGMPPDDFTSLHFSKSAIFGG